MSAADFTRRLSAAEEQAEAVDTTCVLAEAGELLRERAEAEGIPCWSAAEDAGHIEWTTAHGGPELRALSDWFYGVVLDEAIAQGFGVNDIRDLSDFPLFQAGWGDAS